ncbi:MAG: hypothetical protein ACQEXX_01265 [Bacillota bacterium]
MSDKNFFKIKQGTVYDAAVKNHFELRERWSEVFPKVGELLGENVTRLALNKDKLYVDLQEIKKDENRKLFNKDGLLKSNSKRSKQLLEDYKAIIEEVGLTDFEELRVINFIYGVMRYSGEELSSFATSENDIYYEADFDLEKRSTRTSSGESLVIPITEIEYQEKYLEELKKQAS